MNHPKRRLLALATVGALGGCDQPERLGSEAPLDPRAVAVGARFEPLELAVHVLDTHADYDRWERQVLGHGGPRLAYAMYERALSNRRGTPRTFTRWVLLTHREELPDEYREALRPFVDALTQRDDAATNPDILYLVGTLAWLQLTGGPNAPDVPAAGGSAALVDTVQMSWSKLILAEPDWVGPDGVTAALLGRRLASLQGPERVAASPQGAAPAPVAELADFHSAWAIKGPKQACAQLDLALAAVQSTGAKDLAVLGDAYAFCAFERQNPVAAVTHLGKMADARVDGAYGAILRRAELAGGADPGLPAALASARAALDAAVAADPAFAARNGLAPKAP